MIIDRDALRAWLAASCAAQGIPMLVTDPGVISNIGVLLRGRDAAGGPRSGDRRARRSAAPSGNDPVRVHLPASDGSGEDGCEVQNGGDYRGLLGEVQ